MHIISLVVWISVFLFFSTNQSLAQWIESNEGLYGGPVTVMIQSNNFIYSGTYGGVYYSSDRGDFWNKLNDGLTSGAVVNDLVECDGKIFLATNGGPRIHRLSDDHKKWTPVDSGLSTYAITDLVVISSVLFALNNQGVMYKSSNFGNSWEEVLTPFNSLTGIATDGHSLFVSSQNGISKSENLGESWDQSGNGILNKDIYKLDGSDQFLITWSASGIYFSNNSGASWTFINFPLEDYHIEVLASTIIVRSNSSSFISTNSGASWAQLNVPIGTSSLILNDTIFVGTYYGIFRSTDNGINWTESNTGLTNNTVFDIVDRNGNLFTGTSTGVYKSTNDGQSWVKVSVGIPLAQVWGLFIENSIMLAGSTQGIFISQDDGNTWNKVSNAETYCFIKFNGNLFAGTNSGIYQSINNGLSWSLVTASIQPVTSIVVHNSKMWACSPNYVGYSDNGVSWTSAMSGLQQTFTYHHTLFSVDNNLLLGTLNSTVYILNEVSQTWSVRFPEIQGNMVKSFIYKDSTIYFGNSKGVNLVTKDETSSFITQNLPNFLNTADIESLHIHKRKLFASPFSFGIWIWEPCIKPPTPSIEVTSNGCDHTFFTSSFENGNLWYKDSDPIPGTTYQQLTPSESGIYTVAVIDEGCKSDFSLPINFFSFPEARIEMPNVFTPNIDEYNPVFKPKVYEGIESANLTIFNRWGKPVFYTNDLMSGWNGKNNDPATYYYIVTYSDHCKNKHRIKGWLQLIR